MIWGVAKRLCRGGGAVFFLCCYDLNTDKFTYHTHPIYHLCRRFVPIFYQSPPSLFLILQLFFSLYRPSPSPTDFILHLPLVFNGISSKAFLSRCTFSTLSQGENVVVPLITDSLEWTLSSPPPLHQFTEPPLIVECEHLALQPGAEVEEILEAQGETVTDVVGREGWALNDPKLYEGLIPQNCEWTEFVDERTGEWVRLDEFGQRIVEAKK